MSFLDVTTKEDWDVVTGKLYNREQDMTPQLDKWLSDTMLGDQDADDSAQPVMPEDSKTRKGIPLHKGLFAYFPSALAAVAQVSRVCNDKHNPGQPIHWSKENSNDHQDALLRHLIDTASDPEARDPEDGTLLAAKVAWRALANLQVLHDKGVDIFAEECVGHE